MATTKTARPVDAAWLARNLGMALPEPRTARSSGAERAADRRRDAGPDARHHRVRLRGAGRPRVHGRGRARQGSVVVRRDPLAGGSRADARARDRRGTKLPRADVLIVTWTVDEGHALSRVLTPGFDSRDDWVPYTTTSTRSRPRCARAVPRCKPGRLGTYWTTTIGEPAVTLFKSDSHMSQDGPKLPNADVWRQIIDDVRPDWVITTGTAGGIGTAVEVGDVIVSPFVTFSCRSAFKKFDGGRYESTTAAPNGRFTEGQAALRRQRQVPPAGQHPAAEDRRSRPGADGGADDRLFRLRHQRQTLPTARQKRHLGDGRRSPRHGLQGQMGAKAPAYVACATCPTPRSPPNRLPSAEQAKLAGDIYKAYGRWSSVCGAIVCWAIVAGLP